MTDEIATLAEAHERTALPLARVVHCDPEAPETVEEQPLPEVLADRPVSQKSPAEWAYQRLILYLKNFEEQLDRDQEIAMGYAGNEAGVLRIEGIGHFDPDIITFYGRNQGGQRMQVIQHVTQLNVALIAVAKESPEEKPARRIGFRLVTEMKGADRPQTVRRGRGKAGSDTKPPAEKPPADKNPAKGGKTGGT
ncbi:DUF6173 family protein [Szabonella alba]|uniref:DUF6173 family protein n=1 Tax=Szabonella alba TaxID=2804194 RepID=UPI0030800F51